MHRYVGRYVYVSCAVHVVFFRCCDVDVKLMLCGVGWGGVGWAGIITSMHLPSHALPQTRHATLCVFSCQVDVTFTLYSCYVEGVFMLR